MQYSIVRLSELEATMRLDSDYYLPKFLTAEKIIKAKKEKFITLEKLGIKCNASAFYPSLEPFYNQGQFNFLRVKDVDTFINYESSIGIPKQILCDYKTLLVGKKGDIVLTKGGSIGRIGILEKECALTRDLIFFNTSKLSEEDHTFLFIYCLTNFYNVLLIRSSSMTAQPHLTLTLVKDIPLFSPSNTFKSIINKLYIKISTIRSNATSLYQQAESLLLKELGLKDWKPKKQLSYTNKLSEVKKAERIDAEYFQPQFKEIITHVKTKNFMSLGDIVSYSKGVEVGTEEYRKEGVSFVRVSDFSINGFEEVEKKISYELYNTLKDKYSPKVGDILMTKDGTIGITSVINHDYEAILSGAFLRLLTKIDIEKEYVALVLNSLICRKQVEMLSGGAVINHLKPSDAMNLIIPVLNNEIQRQISDTLIKSKEQRVISKAFLEIAKTGVEKAIEESEEYATKWINQELERLHLQI